MHAGTKVGISKDCIECENRIARWKYPFQRVWALLKVTTNKKNITHKIIENGRHLLRTTRVCSPFMSLFTFMIQKTYHTIPRLIKLPMEIPTTTSTKELSDVGVMALTCLRICHRCSSAGWEARVRISISSKWIQAVRLVLLYDFSLQGQRNLADWVASTFSLAGKLSTSGRGREGRLSEAHFNMKFRSQSLGSAESLFPRTYILVALLPNTRSSSDVLFRFRTFCTSLKTSWKALATCSTCSDAATSQKKHSRSLANISPAKTRVKVMIRL